MKIHRIPSQEWRKLLTLDSASPILKVSARRVLGCHQHSQPPLSDPSEISSSCLFEPAATQLPRFSQWNYMEFEDISVATLVILQELREREKECIEIQGNRQWKLIWYVNQCPLRMIFCGVQIFCKPMDGPNEIKLKSILNGQDVATIHSLIRCHVPILCWEALDLEPSKSLDPGFGYPAIFFFFETRISQPKGQPTFKMFETRHLDIRFDYQNQCCGSGSVWFGRIRIRFRRSGSG